MQQTKNGFTLIELLIWLALVATLMLGLSWQMSKAFRESEARSISTDKEILKVGCSKYTAKTGNTPGTVEQITYMENPKVEDFVVILIEKLGTDSSQKEILDNRFKVIDTNLLFGEGYITKLSHGKDMFILDTASGEVYHQDEKDFELINLLPTKSSLMRLDLTDSTNSALSMSSFSTAMTYGNLILVGSDNLTGTDNVKFAKILKTAIGRNIMVDLTPKLYEEINTKAITGLATLNSTTSANFAVTIIQDDGDKIKMEFTYSGVVYQTLLDPKVVK